MFETFTKNGLAVIVDAGDRARRLGSERIGTEHLLLAMVSGSDPVADLLAGFDLTEETVERERQAILNREDSPPTGDEQALADLGIDLDQIREVIESTFGPDALEGIRAIGGAGDDGETGPKRRRRKNPFQRALSARGHLPFSDRAKQAIELSLHHTAKQAIDLSPHHTLTLGRDSIGPVHLLLGVLCTGGGMAARILINHGVSPDELRTSVEESLGRAA